MGNALLAPPSTEEPRMVYMRVDKVVHEDLYVHLRCPDTWDVWIDVEALVVCPDEKEHQFVMKRLKQYLEYDYIVLEFN